MQLLLLKSQIPHDSENDDVFLLLHTGHFGNVILDHRNEKRS
jgi:hypothetical protein